MHNLEIWQIVVAALILAAGFTVAGMAFAKAIEITIEECRKNGKR